ncbi:hypothetical protein V8F33_008089 [Rhypophila sp. PSN 637]
MASKQSKPEQAAQLLQALREAVNDYSLARTDQNKRKGIEELKTKMIDARKALREFLDRVSAEISKTTLLSEEIKWTSKEIMRCRALELAVDEQIKEDEQGHKSKLWAQVEVTFCPRIYHHNLIQMLLADKVIFSTQTQESTRANKSQSPPLAKYKLERNTKKLSKLAAGDEDWEHVEAVNLADEEWVTVLRCHGRPGDLVVTFDYKLYDM